MTDLVFAEHGRSKLRAEARNALRTRWWTSVAVLVGFVTVLTLGCTPAMALSQRGHTFAFAFGSAGSGEGELSDPAGIAIDETNGTVYVADRGNNRVDVFQPVRDGEGRVVGEKFAAEIPVVSPVALAVDSAGSRLYDPSAGDVYVVSAREDKEGEARDRVYKYTPDGTLIQTIARFRETEGEELKFEALDGVTVGPNGEMYVYGEAGEGEERVFVFSNAAKSRGWVSFEPALSGHPTPGLAVNSEQQLYLGDRSENTGVAGRDEGRADVIGKYEKATPETLSEGAAGGQLIEELDIEQSSAVAVNTRDEPANGVDELNDVYVTNLVESGGTVTGSTIGEFNSSGSLIQRFGAGRLREASGVAVETEGGNVFATDAASDTVDVFALEGTGTPTVDALSWCRASEAASCTREAGAVKLSAEVDPHGAVTRAHFEYGQVSCSQAPGACTRSVVNDLGEGFSDVALSSDVRDLAPGTYHLRVVAENGLGASASAEQVFTIARGASGLMDSRAYELVSPPSEHGAVIEALTDEGGLVRASDEGNAFSYVTEGAISEEAQGNRSPEMQQVLATRTPEGWRTADIETPQDKALGVRGGSPPEYQFFSPDLGLALVQPVVGASGAAEPPLAPGVKQATLYVRDDRAGTYRPLVTEANTAVGTTFGGKVHFVDASSDLTHVLVRSSVPLEGETWPPGSGEQLYEWAEGTLTLVSLLPSAVTAHKPILGFYDVVAHAVSNDGARVLFTNEEDNTGRGHLYMRDTTAGHTVQLDAAQGTSEPEGTGGAQFQSATSDGSRVFFTDDRKLTAEATPEEGSETRGRADLYECEIKKEEGGRLRCELKDLTVDHEGGAHAAVQGFLFGVSEDGAIVYLLAKGVLAENENGAGEHAQEGQENLYELHEETGVWQTTFIANLSEEDRPEWDGGEHADSAFSTTHISPNGRYLAFMSQASPTGYDNEDVSSKQPGERMDEEVYLYDALTASLTCVSCDPTGARPLGVLDEENSGEGKGLLVDRRKVWAASGLQRAHWLAGSIPGWTAQSIDSALFQSRYLSNEGRVFFDSADPLLAGTGVRTRDENVAGQTESVGVENVYEYEPQGVGGCESSTGACLALLTGGDSEHESAFLEASNSGNDAFFLTDAQLLPQDEEGGFALYDAHVCTAAAPCLSPPAPAPTGCASTNQCLPASPPSPAPLQAAGTATLSDHSNNAPTSPSSGKREVKPLAPTSSASVTRAQKLAKALTQCRKRYPHAKRWRKRCEARAREQYAPKIKPNRKAKGRESR